MHKLTLSLLVGAALTCEAHAGGFYCADPNVVRSRANEDCTQNEYVSEAAVLCLEKLEAEIDAASKLVSSTAAANATASARTQRGKEVNAAADLRFSEATLNVLIQHAEQAQEEIAFLDKNVLVMPEDYDEPEVTGMDEETYLKSTPCFAENRKLIANVLLDIDVHISDLQRARDTAGKMENTSNRNAAGLSNGSDLKSAKGKGHGPAKPGKRTGNGNSTITGVEEDQSKQKK